MCLGGSNTKTTTTSSSANPVVQEAATNNIKKSQETLANAGKMYEGPLTAGLDPDQAGAIDKAQSIANNGTGEQAAGLIDKYANAGPQSVQANSVASNMGQYMNQYVMQALAPQMKQMDIQNAAENARVASTATGSGAFGDARAGFEASNTAFNQNVARQGMIGQAYSNAFQQAIQAGAIDSNNQLSAENANAGYNETALTRALGGANALQGLQNQQLGVQGAANQMAQQRTANRQAELTAQYNNWLQAQQSQLAAQKSANETVGVGAAAMPATTTSTTSSPDNSGLGILGSILPLVL